MLILLEMGKLRLLYEQRDLKLIDQCVPNKLLWKIR